MRNMTPTGSKKITYGEGAAYLKRLRESEENLGRILGRHLTGAFASPRIKKWMGQKTGQGTFSGIMAWFCLDESVGLAPELFLAIEPKYGFVYPRALREIQALRPEADKLVKPMDMDQLDLDRVDDFEDYLKNYRKAPRGGELELEVPEVERLRKSFAARSEFSKVHSVGHCYFEANEGKTNCITDFLTQGQVAYIRYFFGFDPSESPYAIRIMLIPVTRGGRYIHHNNRGHSFLLQKSWPPPPIKY